MTKCNRTMTKKDYLPNDISRCSNNECVLRFNCLRAVAVPPKGEWFSTARFEPNLDDTCDFLIARELSPQKELENYALALSKNKERDRLVNKHYKALLSQFNSVYDLQQFIQSKVEELDR